VNVTANGETNSQRGREVHRTVCHLLHQQQRHYPNQE